jgi:hypothetical protein
MKSFVYGWEVKKRIAQCVFRHRVAKSQVGTLFFWLFDSNFDFYILYIFFNKIEEFYVNLTFMGLAIFDY